MPSGPVPLSLGQYQQDAGQTGAVGAANAAQGLAGAIIGNPQAIAQARYLGAGTAEETAKAAAQQSDNQAVTQFQALASDPSNYTPQGISKMLATAAASPTLSARASQLIGSALAAQAAPGNGTGQPGAPTISQASNYEALSGNVPMGATPTGFQDDLSNRTGIAQIGAGATVAAADIGARAAMADTAATIQGENQRTLATVLVNGVPTSVRAVDAPGQRYYDPGVANTQAAAAAQPTQYVGPGGIAGLAPAGVVESQGLTPEPASTDQAKAAVFAGAVTPPAAQRAPGLAGVLTGAPAVMPVQQASLAPPATAAQAPAPGAPPGQQPGAPIEQPTVTPDQRQGIVNSTVAQMSGQPIPQTLNPQQTKQMDDQIADRLQQGKPVTFGSNDPSQSLMNPIRLQAAWLLNHDPNVRGNVQQAITQAIINVTGQNGQNYSQNLHVLPATLGGQPGKSQLILNDPSKIVWPDGMPVPPEYQQPSGLAGAIAPGRQTTPSAPSRGPLPGAPQAQAQAQPQQGLSAPAQIMAEAQARINAWEASGQPPNVIQAQVGAIRQRLQQLGVLSAAQPAPGQ